MKMIKPIVNISKIIEGFELIIVGLEGVVAEGGLVRAEAADALINMKKNGKKIVMVTNSSLSIESIVALLRTGGVPAALFDNIVSAGEIVHYMLKAREGEFANIGSTYFNIGNVQDTAVFSWLDYVPVDMLPKADFLFMGSVRNPEDVIDEYIPQLEHAASLNIPLVCVGNDRSSYKNGQICLAPGAIAEQYVALGGRIITVGKPDPRIFEYSLEGMQGLAKEKILVIGDDVTTDIKGASLIGVSSVLVSKGVHVNFLGEGYIPDVAKTREIANNYDAYPDFVISNLRW